MNRLGLTLSLLALVLPAYAKPAVVGRGSEYYVVHKIQDRICAVFEKKPKGSWTIVGTYKSLGEAAAAMKTAADCKAVG